jgi:TRAP-type C4-dicarboxylate transport system permease small subunit
MYSHMKAHRLGCGDERGGEPGGTMTGRGLDLPRVVAIADRLLGLLSTVTLFTMMVLTVVDVIGRYILNAPLHGAYELTEVLLALVVFGAAPLVTRRGTHVTTALFDDRMGPGVKRVRDMSVGVFCACLCVVLAWRLWVQADAAAAMSQGTPLLNVPVALVIYFMAVMSAACVPLFVVAILAPKPAPSGAAQEPGSPA